MSELARQWEVVELKLQSANGYENAYTDVVAWAVFTHDDGTELTRPAFWDGDDVWRVRFASPQASGHWTWRSFSAPHDAGLAGHSGTIAAGPTTSSNRFHRHGFWSIPAGKRNLYHADGTPGLLIGDTPWALPFRATVDDARHYASDRQQKGFNAALLMTVQPDMHATGPRNRTDHDSFDVGFEDLPTGHLNHINVNYFKYLDQLIDVLVAHEIVPVYQPVFHGYGWKGLKVAGPVVPGHEYGRYCRYLVARYGAMPAIWLIGGDGSGLAPGVDAGGWEIEHWDAYHQPTGIHYGPHHPPTAHQDKPWLDFQWSQTGHNGEHVTQRVQMQWDVRPIKAVANGETTYENIGIKGRAAGWWQGHEAWLNLTAGSTMGVVYGAGSLWQWRRDTNEAHAEWCMAQDAGWREALAFEGATYVGRLASFFHGLPFGEMQPDYVRTLGRRALLVPGRLLIVYLESGGNFALAEATDFPRRYRVLDPRTGEQLATGVAETKPFAQVTTPPGGPRVVIFAD